MNSLLLDINENANAMLIEQAVIQDNIILLAEYLSMTANQLDEAVTTWLAKVRNSVANGKLDPNKKDSVTRILGALAAISNPDLADALDEEGDLGTILFNAGDKDKMKSNMGLQRLRDIGRDPSVRTFVSNAADALENPQALDSFTKKIQMDIEPIMNKMLSRERKSTNGTNTPGTAPQQ